MLGLGVHGLRGVVYALCGVAGDVVTVSVGLCWMRGYVRTCVCGGVEGEGCVLAVRV